MSVTIGVGLDKFKNKKYRAKTFKSNSDYRNTMGRNLLVCPKCKEAELTFVKTKRGKKFFRTMSNQNHKKSCKYFREKKRRYNNVNNDKFHLEKKIKNRNIAIMLTLLTFLGIGGLNKFYEGKKIWGIIYLFTFGLYFIGAIIDLIRLFKKKKYYVV